MSDIKVSIIMPTWNTDSFVKIAYNSLRKYNSKDHEIIVLDDNSDDDTQSFFESIKDDPNLIYKRFNEPHIGHPKLYDIGFKMAKNEIGTIFHSDMCSGFDYINQLSKHMIRGRVCSGTRIEPPIHPKDSAKIIKNFGMTAIDFNETAFIDYSKKLIEENKNKITTGIFAPWMIFVEDMIKIGGHWPYGYPTEDSDLFQRFILAGYNIQQIWSATVFHWTCRAHRGWAKTGIGNDTDEFKYKQTQSTRNYLRRWHNWVMIDNESRPIIPHVFDISFNLVGCKQEDLNIVYNTEQFCSTIYLDNDELLSEYIKMEQPHTKWDLTTRVKSIKDIQPHDIELTIDMNQFRSKFKEYFNEIVNMTKNVIEAGSTVDDHLGEFEFGCFTLKINKWLNRSNELVVCKNEIFE